MSRLLLPWISMLLLAACAHGDTESGSTLTILHTNDLHGHVEPWPGWDDLAGKRVGGLDRIATAIDRRYRVATNSLLAEGGHRYRTFLEGQDRREGKPQHALIEAAFRGAGAVDAPSEPRMRQASP